MFKFYDDPTVEESEIVILLGQVWGVCGIKEKILGEKEGKTKLKGRESVETCH